MKTGEQAKELVFRDQIDPDSHRILAVGMMLLRVTCLQMQLLLYLRLTSVAVTSWSYSVYNQNMSWSNSSTWCTKNYTGLMVIQNREQHDYLKRELSQTNKYWIGLRKNASVWMWYGTSKKMESKELWDTNEPNNIKENEDCVEMSIRPGMESNGKFNDEMCNKQKLALCYTEHCRSNPCINGAKCQETINGYNCTCIQMSVGGGKVNCSTGKIPLCTVECLPGHLLLGPQEYSCRPGGSWSLFRPRCASYGHLLLASTMCSILSTVCYCVFCCYFCTKKRNTVIRNQEAIMNPTYEKEDTLLQEVPLSTV